jgi:hypothetical protein
MISLGTHEQEKTIGWASNRIREGRIKRPLTRPFHYFETLNGLFVLRRFFGFEASDPDQIVGRIIVE